MKNILLVFFALLVVFPLAAHGRNWNGIVPSVTTRAEAEKILGESKSGDLEVAKYEYRGSIVEIDYRRKSSDESPRNDVVCLIEVSPGDAVKLKDVDEDLTQFRKHVIDSNIPGHARYMFESDGFSIESRQDQESREEIVIAFLYYQPVSYSDDPAKRQPHCLRPTNPEDEPKPKR